MQTYKSSSRAKLGAVPGLRNRPKNWCGRATNPELKNGGKGAGWFEHHGGLDRHSGKAQGCRNVARSTSRVFADGSSKKSVSSLTTNPRKLLTVIAFPKDSSTGFVRRICSSMPALMYICRHVFMSCSTALGPLSSRKRVDEMMTRSVCTSNQERKNIATLDRASTARDRRSYVGQDEFRGFSLAWSNCDAGPQRLQPDREVTKRKWELEQGYAVDRHLQK